MSTPQEKVMINPNDVVMLLIDHQSGLFNLVKDMSVSQLRNNVIALAKVATMLKIPVITTASVPEGPNGPVIPEIQQFAPHTSNMYRDRARSTHGMCLCSSRPLKRLNAGPS